jgi:hypothetical protein
VEEAQFVSVNYRGRGEKNCIRIQLAPEEGFISIELVGDYIEHTQDGIIMKKATKFIRLMRSGR